MRCKICCFIGHKDAPKEIEIILLQVLKNLIEKETADTFYVGNHGNFDFMIKRVLKALKKEYPHISYSVVLAYMPGKRAEYDYTDYSDTIFPAGLENVPPKYVIVKRNRWMIDKSDTVITYVTNSISNAAQFKEYAERKGKRVINLAK